MRYGGNHRRRFAAFYQEETMKKHLLIALALIITALSLSSCGHKHAWSEWKTTAEATCTADGEQTRTCECGEKETKPIIARDHTSGAEANCTEPQKCTVCDAELNAAKGHTSGAEATCTEAQKCTVCDAELNAAQGHTPGEWTVATPATKTENGVEVKKCTVCGEISEEKIIPAIGSLGLAYTVNADGTTCTVTGIGTCTDTEVVISEVIEGYTVTGIEGFAFEGCTSLTSVVIPDSVTSIGAYAFSFCSSLTSVTIGSGVTCLDNGTFYYCTSLTDVVIPDSVTSIEYYVFYGCSSLTSVVIPDSVTRIGVDTFNDCSSLTSVAIPDSVTSIGNCAFEDCTSLTRVTIGSGVKSIGERAFYGCPKLIEVINKSSLNITAGSTNYGYAAAYAKEVHGGESKIDNRDGYLFYTYNGIHYLVNYIGNETALTLPNDYNEESYEIYHYAFHDRDSLTSVVIPDSVTSIGEYAFYDCSSLTNVVIPDSVTSIEYSAFWNCYKLIEVINKSSLNIAAGSTNHGYVAAYAKEVHGGESKIDNRDGYLFYTYNGINYLVNYIGNETVLTLPNDYNGKAYKINNFAFYGCDALTSVVIPDSVTGIGNGAFENCTSLTSVTIGSSATSIGYYAFLGCDELYTIQFTGTRAQWQAISKGLSWKPYNATQVICSDGVVYI